MNTPFPGKQNGNKESRSQTDVSSLAQEKPSQSNAIEIPSISLPKGGGALKGIDEKFEVNAANGTSSFSIPLPISPGRNGFSPSLSLSYNSGGGNSPYGLGWSVGYPSIQRKTDKRLPRYGDDEMEDTFMLSGAEDLVPFLKEKDGGKWDAWIETNDGYEIKRYRPRIEGGFARIEKINHSGQGIYWKVTTRENSVTIFGRKPETRIADPEDPTRIFEWLPEFSYDDKGNWIQYVYKIDSNDTAERRVALPDSLAEKNRKNGTALFTNHYLKRIKYGNRLPYKPGEQAGFNHHDPSTPSDGAEYFFELVFDYGEHHEAIPTPNEAENQPWSFREDAFSSYRSGFEIRTNRQCKRVLMFHRFEELGDAPCLVRSLDFGYQKSSVNHSGQAETTYLISITQCGYIRKADGSYSKKSLPPMEFEYQDLQWDTEIRAVPPEEIINAPVGLTNNYQWVDLYGEGISGILTEQGEGWFYKSNLGDVDEDRLVRFTPAKRVAQKPSFSGVSSGVLSIQDLEANGEKQVVVNSPGLQGFFELAPEDGDEFEEWEPFVAFEEMPNIDFRDANTRMIDINGDGQAELVISEENVFVWYAGNGKKGHKPAEFTAKTFDEEQGPAIVFADQLQTIFLADMSGDGLTDIVRIRNGEICYWANKGYGRFSAKISMANAPLFDHPDLFNPQYLHLADMDGTGPTDIFYLGQNKFRAYLNLSGNAWSDAHEIEPFFPIDSNSRVSVIDLLGTGTSCIVWSSDLPGYAEAPMRYIDLMDSTKPHVIKQYVNNFGKITSVEYKSSTHFYLKDKLAGTPWKTKLPFPVQVVSKTIVEDKISDVRFTSQYRYHHGYYDHSEREFRGFGMVEQEDSEHYETWKNSNAGNQLETSGQLYQAPVLTKTWFHTGAFLDRKRLLEHFKDEYWQPEYNRRFPNAPLPDEVKEYELKDARLMASDYIKVANIIDELSADEWREALRACKGMTLRQEVFALDASKPDAGAAQKETEKYQQRFKPYTVATHNCNIQLLQPRAGNQYAVFLVTESEALTYQYERDETDPRIAHTLDVNIDDLGNVLESASVVYPRKKEDGNLPQATKNEQNKTHIIYTQNSFANFNDYVEDIDIPEAYRLRLPKETRTYEITGLPKPAANVLYQLADFKDILTKESTEIGYHESPGGGTERRLIEHIRSLYIKDDLSGALPFGKFESKGIPYENYQLAYTPDLLTYIFAGKIPDQTATMTEGRFVDLSKEAGFALLNEKTSWWIRSGLIEYDPTFFLPQAYTDPFGSKTTVGYYKDYNLFQESTKDALGSEVKVNAFNFRTLSPQQMRDANYNLSEVLTDELGLVKAVALLGKDRDNDKEAELQLADNLVGLGETTTDEQGIIQNFFREENSYELNRIAKADLLKNATSRFVYDFEVYKNTGNPVVVASVIREQHHIQNSDSPLQISFEYTDGLGKVAMTKVQAEPGVANRFGENADGTIAMQAVNTLNKEAKGDVPPLNRGAEKQLRWVGTGRTVLNNKGNPVKQYEPYFSITPHFDRTEYLAEIGVTPILFYDSPGRLIKTELPDKTYTKVEFDAWKQATYDQNDTVQLSEAAGTVTESQWYADRINRRMDAELARAGKDPAKEQQAARNAAVHAGTPSVVHLDTLGRPILSVAHNKKVSQRNATGNPVQYQDEFHNTLIELDIEGNARSVTDAGDNVVMRYQYDMLGHRVYQDSMDAGERWMLNNVLGNPVVRWDSKNNVFSFGYDDLHRPTKMRVESGGSTLTYESIEYGDKKGMTGLQRQAALLANQIGKEAIHSDTSGRVEFQEYDIKGNLLKSQKKHLQGYTALPDWDAAPVLDDEIFQLETTFDALNRPTKETVKHWDGNAANAEDAAKPNTTSYTYNEAGLLETVKAVVNGKAEKEFVKDIDYNEKGQRTKIKYGNNATTTYTYDRETFRLINLHTFKVGGNGEVFQDLKYTYDPVGNITAIRNDAEDTIFFNNQKVEPSNDYEYDPLYRLIFATGREHIGQAQQHKNKPDSQFDEYRTGIAHPGDGTAMQTYRQYYEYDEVGNMTKQTHRSGVGNFEIRWTKTFEYSNTNNQLRKLSLGDGAPQDVSNYTFDAHGNMEALNPTFQLTWNPFDQMKNVSLQNNGVAYYTYDAAGQRTRKVITENNNLVKERIYFGHFEIFRAGDLERETWHIMDDTRRVALVETRTKGDDGTLEQLIRYQFTNHLECSLLELDDNTTPITYEEYYPYGSTSYQAVNDEIKSAAKRYRYTGKERDEESGLYYHGARYYASWMGIWISCDPLEGNILSPLSLHSYIYVHDNPIIYNDPDGRAINLAAAGIGAAIGGIGGAIVGAWNAKPGERWSAAAKGGAIGAGAGALAGLTFGASLAATGAVGIGGTALATGGTTGSVLVSSTVAGAVAGGTGAAGNTLLEGGTAREALEKGAVGAFVGSVGGAVGGASATVTTNFVSSTGASQFTSYTIGGATAGASGDLAAQSTALALGAQEEISVAELAVAAVGGATGGGLTALKSPGLVSDKALVARANKLHRKVATSVLEAKGKPVTEGAIGSMKREVTVGVLQAEINGKNTTLIAVNNPKFQQALKGVAAPGEAVVEPLRLTKLSARTGKPLKTGGIDVHAEQVLANEAKLMGASGGRVATSNKGCPTCTSHFGEAYPEVRHVNPRNPR